MIAVSGRIRREKNRPVLKLSRVITGYHTPVAVIIAVRRSHMATMYEKVVDRLTERIISQAIENDRLTRENRVLRKQLQEASYKMDELRYGMQGVRNVQEQA